MAKRELRFGIRDTENHQASTWKLWTETNGSELYLVCRSLGGTLKTSLHESGKWHIAYSQSAFEKNVKGVISEAKDRFIERWSRPIEIAPGFTLAYRIVTHWSITTNYNEEGANKGVIWLPNATENKATEIDIIITESTMSVSGWPGKRSMGTSLIGSFPLKNGDTVWAVYWVTDMPDLSSLDKARFRFYRGKSKEDLVVEELRVLVFGENPDGSRSIYDCSLEKS